MELVIQVQFLDKAVCISLFTNAKGMNLLVLPSAIGK